MMRRVGLRALVGLHEKLWRGTVKRQARPSAQDAQPAPAEHQAQRKRAQRALHLLVRLLRMIRCPCAMLCSSSRIVPVSVRACKCYIAVRIAFRLLSAAARCATPSGHCASIHEGVSDHSPNFAGATETSAPSPHWKDVVGDAFLTALKAQASMQEVTLLNRNALPASKIAHVEANKALVSVSLSRLCKHVCGKCLSI